MALIQALTAIVVIVLLIPPLALAQDVSERPNGVICRQPECDLTKSLPFHAEFPLHIQEDLIARVKNMPASVLDAGLPAIPFDLWLLRTLEGQLSRTPDVFPDWSPTFCDEPARAIPGVGPDLCVEISVPLEESKVAKLFVGVAAGHIAYGLVVSWSDIEPDVRDIYIERFDNQTMVDTLDVKRLSDLEAQVRLPVQEWPAVDLKTTITFSPALPLPGQQVRFTVTIANTGPRDAARAQVDIYIAIPDRDQNIKEIRRDWFPSVPAGKTVSLEISATLGRGDATIMASTEPFQHRRAREVNPKDNNALVEIPFIH